MLNSDHVSKEDKAQLREAYGYLDLVSLRRRINELQDQLIATLTEPQTSSAVEVHYP
jgi:hypothetical protein